VKIGRLYATQRGAAQRVVHAVTERRAIPIHDVFRYGGPGRIVEAAGAGLETAPFGAGEPTF
jgi:hypothetical protein